MDQKQINGIKDLIQLDIDAIHAYEEAIGKIDNANIRSALMDFKNDHHNHIQRFSELLKANGALPPENKQDFKGYLIEGMTTLRSMTGTKGALKAMAQNEGLTNKYYERASDKDFPMNVKAAIQQALLDEKKHKEFIESAIEAIREKRVDSFHYHRQEERPHSNP